MRPTHVDALLVTALQLERRAVRAHLQEVAIEKVSGSAADIGTFRVGERDLTVAVLETGAGNVAASTLTLHAEEKLRPAVVMMLGIAGGLKDVRIGDVVASSKVYWYEGGKQLGKFQPRPDFAPVSPALVQAARAVTAEEHWLERLDSLEASHPVDEIPHAFVAPVVVGEKVLADSRSEVVRDIRATYGDALTADMEDYGALRGGAHSERARTIAVRGVSDLLDAKADADARGSQSRAARNAAAFGFELLAMHFERLTITVDVHALAALGARLYPEGPQQHGLWERAGGDVSRLASNGTGFARWWDAARLLEKGGGGAITTADLLDAMLAEFPGNPTLQEMRAQC